MKWVITGGRGVHRRAMPPSRFHKAGHHVVVVDNLSRRGADANLAWLREQGITDFVKADVRDAGAMDDLDRAGTPTPTPCSTSPPRSP